MTCAIQQPTVLSSRRHRLLWLPILLWLHWGGQPAAWGAESRQAIRPGQPLAQVEHINEQLRQRWKEQRIEPSRAATDAEWCRRVFLDILGRIPTVDELRAFTRSRAPTHKPNWSMHCCMATSIQRSMRNWTTVWTNLLIGRSGGTQRGSLISREGMQQYLREAFTSNKPYNELAYELITATGSTAPDTEDFNGAVNFLVMKIEDDKATQATAATAAHLPRPAVAVHAVP